uniref:Uncharacterized protein n=1 Tax=Arundo donax TaxID=35708 RepID=A0A0A9F826_ARUDO
MALILSIDLHSRGFTRTFSEFTLGLV